MTTIQLITTSIILLIAWPQVIHCGLVNITWTNSLDSVEDLDAFKKGTDQIALEALTLNADGETVLMGVDPSGSLTLKDCLTVMAQFNQKASPVKYVKLDIRFLLLFDKMRPDISAVGPTTWLIFHFDYFTGPGGATPTMNVLEFKTKVVGRIPVQSTISFGFTMRMVGDPGYTKEMVDNMKKEWTDNGFGVVLTPEYRTLKTSFMLHIVHLSKANKEAQKELKEFISQFGSVEMRLAKDHLRLVNYQSFKEFLGDFGIDKVYFNVPTEFHQAFQDGGLPGMEGYNGQWGVKPVVFVLWVGCAFSLRLF